MPLTSRDLFIPADDGYPLAATLFEADDPQARPERPIVIVGAATAVPRRYYAPFARFLAAEGSRALTFDYRGVGGSSPAALVGFAARMRDWGVLDTPGVLGWTLAQYPKAPIRWLGHSFGGFGPGLAHNNGAIERMLAVSTMTAHWRLLPSPERYRVALLMGALLPGLTHALRYFPGKLNGFENLPKGVLLEWARWCMTPGFLFGDESLGERRYFAQLRSPVRLTLIEDDPWVSSASVEHLAAQFTGSAETSVWRIRPSDAGVRRIGHVGFFRSECAPTLWQAARDWLAGHPLSASSVRPTS
jgi:predicted alpha/beta hydrolase